MPHSIYKLPPSPPPPPTHTHFDIILSSYQFQGLDFVIVEARKHNIRLILSLVNNLKAYGGTAQYMRWAQDAGANVSSSRDAFFTNPTVKAYYKSFVKVCSN